VQVIGVRRAALHNADPILLFLHRPDADRLSAKDATGANIVCATVQFGGAGNPMTDCLSPLVLLKRLKGAVTDNANVFEVLMDAVRVCSLGQIATYSVAFNAVSIELWLIQHMKKRLKRRFFMLAGLNNSPKPRNRSTALFRSLARILFAAG
jgi:hypothetical protein